MLYTTANNTELKSGTKGEPLAWGAKVRNTR